MSSNLQLIEKISPIGNLEAYIQTIKQFPVLTADQEQVLARRFYDQNDLDAARQLVLSHLRFVVKIAQGYAGYGLPQADLVQEGNIGLMKAIKRFDPNMGVRLISFAVHWIKAEIHEFILRNWRIVKVATTKAQRKLFFNLRNAKKRLGWFTLAEVNAVAEDLGVSPKTVVEMEQRLSANDMTFDIIGDDDDHHDSQTHLAPVQYLEDHRYDPVVQLEAKQQEQGQQRLHTALAKLDERSQDILTRRWLAEEKATLQELAEYYDVSAERIRQLEQNAMKKLKETMTRD